MSLTPYWIRHLRSLARRDPLLRVFEDPFAIFLKDPFYRDPTKYFKQVNAQFEHGIEGVYSDSEVKVNGKKVEVQLDVRNFTPEQIRVKTVGNEVTVEGRREETRERGWTRSHFQRTFVLPEGFPPERVECHLDEGKLKLLAYRAEPLPLEERNIPIHDKSGVSQVAGMARAVVARAGARYEVWAGGARVLAARGAPVLAGEELLAAAARPFSLLLCDRHQAPVISVRRPFSLGCSKMEVVVAGGARCVVRQEVTLHTPLVSVNDAADRPVLRVKGRADSAFGGPHLHYDVQSARDRRSVGCIRRLSEAEAAAAGAALAGGAAPAGGAARFEVAFPEELDVRYKAALLATCILLDFLYHEKS